MYSATGVVFTGAKPSQAEILDPFSCPRNRSFFSRRSLLDMPCRGHCESLHSFMIDHCIVIRSEARPRCSAAISQHGPFGIQRERFGTNRPALHHSGADIVGQPRRVMRHFHTGYTCNCATAGSNFPARPMKTRGCSLG